jgi:hypothetical protein
MPSDHGRPGDRAVKYNFCPACKELWRADWVEHRAVTTCPACDGPVLPHIPRSQAADPSDTARG